MLLVQETRWCLGDIIHERVVRLMQELDRFLASVERRAFRMAEFATGNADEALDIVQDAMLKLARKYPHKNPDQWRPIFFRVLANCINDWHRRHKVRKIITGFFGASENDDADAEMEYASAELHPDQKLSSEEVSSAISAAIKTLPARQQQTFLLRVWEGFDVRETANIMGVSEGSVKTHLARANQQLQQLLVEYKNE